MAITRRAFIQYCLGSASVLGLKMSVVGRLQQALAEGTTSLPTVIWLSGANCTGCTVSLANLVDDSGPTDVADLLINYINLAYHPNLMGAAGELAVNTLEQATQGPYVLAVEGGIPTAFEGHTCVLWSKNGEEVTALSAVRSLAPRAIAVLSIGTCASFGGIPAAGPNPTGITSVKNSAGVATINIPGCPTHPDWIVWVVANLLVGNIPTLDAQGRPAELFGTRESDTVHERCPRREREETETFGIEGRCLEELGCKGERTSGDCPVRKWNGGSNWCIGANSICLGCTEQGFPDRFSPFYEHTRFASCSGFCVHRAKWEPR